MSDTDGRLARAATPLQPGASEELDQLRTDGNLLAILTRPLALAKADLGHKLQIDLHARPRHRRPWAFPNGEARQPAGVPAGGLEGHSVRRWSPAGPDVAAREIWTRPAELQQVPHELRRDCDAGPRP